MFYWIIVVIAWALWHIAFRIKVVGRENVITDRPFVMVSNHVTAVDPVFLVISRLFEKKMLVLGKAELFDNKFLNWFLRGVGVVPVARGRGDTGVIEDAITHITEKKCGLLIFPEGTRSKDGNLQKLKSGAFVIAQKANADILPCRIIIKGGKLKFWSKVTVVFGKPIPIESLNLDGKASSIRNAKGILTTEMENLLEANCGNY